MQPLTFSPILKRIRWGGRRLGTLLGKPLGPETDYAESWEIVDHGDDQSTVAAGPFAGWTLKKLVKERGTELFGRHAGRRQFPLLVKFLDANDRLSLQVHPNDVQAKQFDPSENGKTEAWVIVHADPGSRLVCRSESRRGPREPAAVISTRTAWRTACTVLKSRRAIACSFRRARCTRSPRASSSRRFSNPAI